jgi:bacterioferritin (cytochrome b1)
MKLNERIAFFEKHPTINEQNIHAALDKAKGCYMLNVENLPAHMVAETKECETAIGIQRALQYRDEMGAAEAGMEYLYKTARAYANGPGTVPLETARAPIAVRIGHLSTILGTAGTTLETVAACAVSGVAMDLSPKNLAGREITKLLNDAALVGVCPVRGSNGDRVKEMLKSNLGVTYGTKRGRIQAIKISKVLAYMQAKPLQRKLQPYEGDEPWLQHEGDDMDLSDPSTREEKIDELYVMRDDAVYNKRKAAEQEENTEKRPRIELVNKIFVSA